MNGSYSYFKSYKVWLALYQISISMQPYVLLDVEWCNSNYLENTYIIKTCALKLLLSTNAFSECHQIFFYPWSCNNPFVWLYLLKNLNEWKFCTHYVVFCMQLSFCPCSFGHCIVCLSLIDGFWIPLLVSSNF